MKKVFKEYKVGDEKIDQLIEIPVIHTATLIIHNEIYKGNKWTRAILRELLF